MNCDIFEHGQIPTSDKIRRTLNHVHMCKINDQCHLADFAETTVSLLSDKECAHVS